MGTPTVVCVSGRRVLEVLAAMGATVILVDDEIPIEAACAVDVPVEADLTDWQAAEAAVRGVLAGRHADAVLSVRDSHVPLASYLAARLGIPGLALPAALNCHSKARMRRALAGAGVPNPRFGIVLDPRDGPWLAGTVGFPLVLKRTRGAGGARVRLCRDTTELATAIAELSEGQRPVELLAEEYLDGPEYAVQTVTQGGRTEVLSVLRTHIGPSPRFAETGYDYPAGLGAQGEREVARYVAAALAAAGFDRGVTHTQVRVTADGPRVVEINPRPPGGLLAHLTHMVSGVDMVRAAAEISLGLPLTRTPPQASHALYRCVVFPESGYLDYDPPALAPFTGRASLAAVAEMDAEPGDLVLAVDDPDGGVYGRVLLFGTDQPGLESAYHDVMARLRVSVHPRPLPRHTPAPSASPYGW